MDSQATRENSLLGYEHVPMTRLRTRRIVTKYTVTYPTAQSNPDSKPEPQRQTIEPQRFDSGSRRNFGEIHL
jgi:hypothetical protein